MSEAGGDGEEERTVAHNEGVLHLLAREVQPESHPLMYYAPVDGIPLIDIPDNKI